MATSAPSRGLLRVVPPAELDAQIAASDRHAADIADAAKAAADQVVETQLAGHIRNQFEIMSRHRDDAVAGWSERLLVALRAFNGQYPADKLAEIKKFGGSEVYARVIAMKCRGASSLLRDIYLAPDRAWGIQPPADPDVPPEIIEGIKQLVMAESDHMVAAGQSAAIDPGAIRDRTEQLMDAARMAAKKRAKNKAKLAEDRIDEILTDGQFYKAVSEFLVDLPLFPFACIKGPVVRIVPSVKWEPAGAVVEQKPRLFWERVSPFDLWWTPGATSIESADVIERARLSRSDLNDLLDIPGYHHENIRAVLEAYGSGGLVENWDSTDAERAQQESRENPQTNRSGRISCLEFHGNIQGKLLLDFGIGPEKIPDPLRDYFVQAWLIGRYIIKVQLSPSPRKRHPYYISSFEKVPGTPVGNGLPDILSDVGDVANATLRALVNNLSIASGPQVVINDDRMSNDEDGEDLHPWKRWHVTSDPMGQNTQVPVSFFQPVSNSQELLQVYKELNNIADELSAIPKYLAGGGASGGAGRTAAGLAMLMGNASKILQTVAANIDRDVYDPLFANLYDMLMLTDNEIALSGDEWIRVMGVNVAVQRETERARQLEFLQITANPMDAQIMGPAGRAKVLRSVSETIGLDGDGIVPPDDEVVKSAMLAEQAAAAQGGQKSGATNDQGPRTRITGGAG